MRKNQIVFYIAIIVLENNISTFLKKNEIIKIINIIIIN